MKFSFLKTFILVGAAVAFATPADAVIVGSKHDLATGTAIRGTSDQTCAYCHTPHQPDGASALTGAPLWNRQNNPTASYTLYTNASMNHTTAQPGVMSKVCLSCHDGALSTGALLNIGGTSSVNIVMTPELTAGATYTAGVMQTGTAFQVGTNLSNDHPVGFPIVQATLTADGGFKTLAVMQASSLKLFGAANNELECSTCHDVHNGTGFNFFLRVDTAASLICTTCHNK